MPEDSNYNPGGRQPSTSFQLNNPTIVSLLYLVGLVTGVASLIAVILAYVWKGEPHADWETSHFRFHIRTFWIGLLQVLIGFALLIVGIGVAIMIWVAVWTAVRSIKAMLAAQKELPLAQPETLLW